METIGKNKFVRAVAGKSDNYIKICRPVIDAFIDEITDILVRGDKLVLMNFMSFETIERAEREGKDLKTGEAVTYPPIKTVKCKVSKTIKDLINK